MPKRTKAFELPAFSAFDVVANNELASLLAVLAAASQSLVDSPLKASSDESPKKGSSQSSVGIHPSLLGLKPSDFSAGRDRGYFTPLHVACAHGHWEVARTLLTHEQLAKDVDVNAVTDQGVTPLHCAAYNGHEDVVKLLLERGANPMMADANNDLPLHLARRGQHSTIVVALEPAFFKLFDPSRDPIQAFEADDVLHFQLCASLARDEAIQRGDRSHSAGSDDPAVLVGSLHPKHTGSITSKMSFDADSEGNTVLHLVALRAVPCSSRAMKIAELVLQNQWFSSIDSRNKAGYTPLQAAAEQGNALLVEQLLQCGASALATCGRGDTALSLSKDPHTKALLEHAELKAELSTMLAGKNRVPLENRPDFVVKAKQLKRRIIAAGRRIEKKQFLVQAADEGEPAAE